MSDDEPSAELAASNHHNMPSTASMELELPIEEVTGIEFSMTHGDRDPTPLASPNNNAADFQPAVARSSSGLLSHIQRTGVELYVWGRGDCGQLGDGTQSDCPLPHRIESLMGKPIVHAAAGSFHSAAITADGEVFIWGDNTEGQLGVKTQQGAEESTVPTRVETLENFSIGSIACGAGHTLAVAVDGTVLAVGQAEHGRLGLGEIDATRIERPKVVKALKGTFVGQVAAGGRHSIFLDAGGGVYTCGDGSFGALGLGNTDSVATSQPLLRLWPLGIVSVSAGESHSAALTLDGTVFTWGRGRSGQLGLGDFQNAATPSAVKALSGRAVRHIACGGDHTVAVTTDGSVYTWGQGKWGATGLSHVENVCTPQRVQKIADERVVAAAAGGRHTLLLSASNEVWASGCNENGQAGGEMGGTVMAPRKVSGFPPDCEICFLEAGGDHSIAVVQQKGVCSSDQKGDQSDSNAPFSSRQSVEAVCIDNTCLAAMEAQRRQWERRLQPPSLVEAMERAKVKGKDDIGAMNALVSCIERTFACPAFLLHALTQPPEFGCEEPVALAVPGAYVDVSGVSKVYQPLLMLYDQRVVATLGTATVKLLDNIEKYLQLEHQPVLPAGKPQSPEGLNNPLNPDLSWLPATLVVLLQNPLAGDPATYGGHIILRLGRIIAATLPATQRIPVRRAMQALLRVLSADTFASRCVRPVQRYVTHLVESGRAKTARLELMMAGILLDVLVQADVEAGGKLPYTEYYNHALSSHLDLHAEYLSWVKHRDSAPSALVSFCQMPYLLDTEAKSRVLHGESMIQKEQALSAAAMRAFFQGQNPTEAGFLRIAVRRTHVVEDALNALILHGTSGSDDLKKPLKVTFVSGGVPEPAQDEGGVRKEFFQLLSRDLFRAEFGMFVFDEATRTYWFNPASLESAEEYALVGALLGLAIYNAVLLDIHFPAVLYKKLLGDGSRIGFADLKSAFPELGRGLQSLLDYEPAADIEDVFCRAFEVEYEFYGEKKTHELKPGGSEIHVTGANRAEYVELYTKWVLEDSIATQFSAFQRAFLRVCGGPALTLFTPAELELLVCGLPHLDFKGLRMAAVYEGGYTAETPGVQWFWEIVESMSLERKRQFLSFTTGSDRAPVGGLGRLTIRIQRAGPDTDRLPTSHTCFNTLLLPEYASKEKMKERLLTAVTNAQGFGLQ